MADTLNIDDKSEKDEVEVKGKTGLFRQKFIQFWKAIDQHGAEHEKYVSNFEKALNPFFPTKNVFAITDIHSYRTIIAEITANHPDLAYLNDENKLAPGGPKTQINSTHNHYIEFLTVLDILNNQTNSIKAKPGKTNLDGLHLQQIFFGAPGTGKSHTIEKCTKEQTEHVVRTTFHPDTDYATFVGAYKPTTKTIPVTTVIGTKAVPVEDAQGKPVTENKIVYEFVPQAFLRAYVAAWRAQLQQSAEAEYLVIEEINRGNCAQIFGDLFQLLDRTDSGFSEYPIKADTDMQHFLSGQFADLAISHIEGLEDNVLTRVLSGEELVLPNNLYIWATMNTSDQSLFPIDSAFKRRWDWKYIPINNANLDYKIDVDGAKYDWWEFLTKINEKIGSATNSEDKKLGYFFCKADQEKNISAERFVSKVVFYLWNDVFKDLDESEVFRDGDGILTFDKFYIADGSVNAEKVKTFLENLGLEPIDPEEYFGQEETIDIPERDRSTWSETESKRYEFWEQFLTYAQQNAEFSNCFGGVKKPSIRGYKNFFIPGVDFHLVARQQRTKNRVEVQVYFNETNDIYNRLRSHKGDIEKEMGVVYEWKELQDNKASIVSECKSNVDFENKENWKSIFDFFIDRLLRMRKVFVKYAAE